MSVFRAIGEKKNRVWLYAGLGVIGIIVLFAMIGRGSNGGAVQTGSSDAAIAANAQLMALGMQHSQAAVMAQLESDTALSIAAMQAQAQAHELDISLAALQSQIGAQVYVAELEREVNLAGLDVTRELGHRQISAQEQFMLADLAASIERERIASETMIAQRELDIRLVQASRPQPQPQQKKSSGIGGILGAVGGLFKLFSDVRLKENIIWKGELPSGLNIYEYNYAGSDIRVAGVMAQEVELIAPEAVEVIDGYKTVDYSRLPQ